MPYAMKTIRLVIVVWLYSASLFDDSPDDQVLEDLLCRAVSDSIQDELAGIKRHPSEVLEGVIARVRPALPKSIEAAYRSVTATDFAKMLGIFRKHAADDNVNLSELSIFISHAGADTAKAKELAAVLSKVGLEVHVDRGEITPGESILTYMEKALSRSDYCLLLWSRTAAQRPWVKIEWEAALYRTVEESRHFLVIGRLEPWPLPVLLRPRLLIELFPELRPGVDELIDIWRKDSVAQDSSRRPIVNCAIAAVAEEDGDVIYLTSELFGKVTPIKIAFDIPCGVHLDWIILNMAFPLQYDFQGRIGVRFEYYLVHQGTRLARTKSLAAQGVTPGEVVWLEVEMTPFAAKEPVGGVLGGAIFRGDKDAHTNDVRIFARKELLHAISRAGLAG
jgi:hypothetical protein